MIDAISLHIGILCAVACILGLYFIVISLVVNYGDTDESEEKEPILTPIDSTTPIDGYTYCPPNRFILIADDEKNIREGLKCILDWESLGFHICGEASTAE